VPENIPAADSVTSPRNVFVIDDSATMRRMIADALQQRGYGVQSAPSMDVALPKLAHFRSGIVIVDIFMPGMSGVDGIGIIKERWPDLPVIAMSAGTGAKTPVDALTAARLMGADAVMQKPFEMDALMAKIDDLIGGHPCDDEHRQRILVVDDSSTVRKLIGEYLASPKYHVMFADSIEAAIASPEIVGIDVVITDIFMPGIGGIEGIRVFRDHWPTCRIIAMSAGYADRMSGDMSLLAATKVGADGILSKPFPKDDLLGIMDAFV